LPVGAAEHVGLEPPRRLLGGALQGLARKVDVHDAKLGGEALAPVGTMAGFVGGKEGDVSSEWGVVKGLEMRVGWIGGVGDQQTETGLAGKGCSSTHHSQLSMKLHTK